MYGEVLNGHNAKTWAITCCGDVRRIFSNSSLMTSCWCCFFNTISEEHRLKLAEWAQLEERFAAATAERLREAAEWTARLAHAELADERSRALSAELRVTRRHAEGSAAEAAQSAELAAARLGEMLGELGETRGKVTTLTACSQCTHYAPSATCCSPRTTHYAPLTTHYSLRTTTTHHSLAATPDSLRVTHCSPPHCSLRRRPS